MNLVFKALVMRYGPEVAKYLWQLIKDNKAHKNGPGNGNRPSH